MRRFSILVFLIAALPASVSAGSNYATAAPPTARFEILQSSLTMRDTYRLDRVTGRVDRLVLTRQGDPVWENIPVSGGLPPVTDAVPRFQLFLSGIAAKGTYLIDTFTGKTWELILATPSQPGEASYEIWAPL